jgi:hypothetical protein
MLNKHLNVQVLHSAAELESTMFCYATQGKMLKSFTFENCYFFLVTEKRNV